MESFVTSLDNPAYREQLSRALTMGKGVFRAFKDTLKENKEIEKLWFDYKERRLRGVIVSWYNANREARGLAKLPVEPEETEELVMSDFSFAWEIGGARRRRSSSSTAMPSSSSFPAKNRAELEERYAEKRDGICRSGDEESPILIAETPGGGPRGFAWGVIEGSTVHIVQLAVAPGLRGIGLGEALLRQFLTDMRARGHAAADHRACGQVAALLGLLPVRGVRPVDAGHGVQPGRAAVLIAPGERRSRCAERPPSTALLAE